MRPLQALLEFTVSLLKLPSTLVQFFRAINHSHRVCFSHMKISLNWLGDYIEWIEPFDPTQGKNDPQEIVRKITAHTAEVDAVHQQGALLDKCCVGKVLTVSKHPNADKLSLCDVQTDKGNKRVVCGGTNLREGMKIIFAHVGACVRASNGELFTLEKIKIRGEESNGMICAAEEIGLETMYPTLPEQGKSPVIDMGDDDDGVGTAARDHLGFSDIVLDIDNHAITQRADLFSHIGFARECVAMGIAKWKKDPSFKLPEFPKKDLPFQFIVDDSHLMPRYCACVIEIDSLGETPDWMKQRLEAVGWRSLNLPIDITNFVASEIGVPLHSFDLDDLKGDVHMRIAKKGEKIVTLDEKERELSEGALILSDDIGVFDLLGIMGGLRSSTKDTTKRIYLHSASLDPVSIRNAVIAMGHRTDAATVYEKGVPFVTAEQGFIRALNLFLELVPGAKVTSKMENWGENGISPVITLKKQRVFDVLGVDIPEKQTAQILKDLGCEVTDKKDDLAVKPPLWRLGDLQGEHDLLEEIGRIYGYDAIEPIIPMAAITPPVRDQRIHQMRDALKMADAIEITPLSFVGPALLSKCNIGTDDCVQVDNPLGEEYSFMQPTTLPSLLAHAQDNLKHVEHTLKTFTARNVFRTKDEWMELGFCITSKKDNGIKEDPFLIAKADLMSALSDAGYRLSLVPSKKPFPFQHSGRSADVIVGETSVGLLFEVHPSVCSAFDLPNRVAVALLDLRTLFSLESNHEEVRSVPDYPSVVYDVTIPMSQDRAVGELLSKARSSSLLLEGIEVADLYSEGGQKYNLTVRCTYRSSERTLTEEEVKLEHDKVLAVLQ